jgi:hypothetical protein
MQQWYSPTHANLSTEIKVGDQHHALASLSQGQSLATLVEEAGWAPGPVWRFWRRENSLPTLGFEPCNIQPVASCYTSCYPGSITVQSMVFWRLPIVQPSF